MYAIILKKLRLKTPLVVRQMDSKQYENKWFQINNVNSSWRNRKKNPHNQLKVDT